ncbi:zinc finger CCCH domain-containing protein 12-like isoform X1 [Andrographis paniculata]|uniref:zinc finger CCCH domain-containing protein 12-like isoform X1 n=1 Tax=Andrographis paniculata TaxID=175694 RepID=UPI0021E80EBB|nr:zinc finger CCCH domain-containing protein 12-like isoform X1 [Andrographis paniculata]
MLMDCHQSISFADEDFVGFHSSNPEKEIGLRENFELSLTPHVFMPTKGGVCNRDLEVGNEVPKKKTRNSLTSDLLSLNRSQAEGQDLPPNFKKPVSSTKENAGLSDGKEVFQIPVMNLSHDRRLCKLKRACRLFSQGGCPYDVYCPFTHDEQLEKREYAAICLVPGKDVADKYKTKMSTNWKSFGTHGKGLQSDQYGATMIPLAPAGIVNPSVVSVTRSSRTRATPWKLPEMAATPGEVRIRKWNGPDKISKIYGDWIDDL